MGLRCTSSKIGVVLMQGYANSWMAISRSWFNRIPSVRDSRSRDGDGRVDQVADLDNVLAPVVSGGLNSGLCLAAQALLPRWPSLPLSRPAPWMRWTWSRRIVSFPYPTRIRLPRRPSKESWGAKTLPIFCRHVTEFFAVAEEKFYWQCDSPMNDSSL
jgi:hypothetical protein